MRVAVVGAGGQLGAELVDRLGAQAVPLTHADIEIADRDSVRRALSAAGPDAVVNCAAWNLVDQAEQEPEAAFRVNAVGPRLLAVDCAERAIPLLHVSTDYVFGLDTPTRPLRESDLPAPVNVYGASKLAGEHCVRSASPRHLVVRTCGLYGRPGTGSKGNFVRTILKLARERDELRVVNDQRCTPTSACDLAAALVDLLATEASGTFHAVNSGDCTWHELAAATVEQAGLSTRVVPVATAEFPRPARRPAYSVLDCSRLEATIGRPLPPWRDALGRYLAPLID